MLLLRLSLEERPPYYLAQSVMDLPEAFHLLFTDLVRFEEMPDQDTIEKNCQQLVQLIERMNMEMSLTVSRTPWCGPVYGVLLDGIPPFMLSRLERQLYEIGLAPTYTALDYGFGEFLGFISPPEGRFP